MLATYDAKSKGTKDALGALSAARVKLIYTVSVKGAVNGELPLTHNIIQHDVAMSDDDEFIDIVGHYAIPRHPATLIQAAYRGYILRRQLFTDRMRELVANLRRTYRYSIMPPNNLPYDSDTPSVMVGVKRARDTLLFSVAPRPRTPKPKDRVPNPYS